MSPRASLSFRILKWWFAATVIIAFCLLRWGNNLLVATVSLPSHADAAVVLQGSITAEKARIAGAMDLLRRGAVNRVLLGVPKESYWGQSIAPVARTYLERTYGDDLAAQVDFCETGSEANSTFLESRTLRTCIREHHWQSIVLVTSNYHTRRAGLIWRRATEDGNVRVWIDGVDDPEFEHPWWRHRQSAKIWLLESTKLIWAIFGGE
jgi:hypothetical protein